MTPPDGDPPPFRVGHGYDLHRLGRHATARLMIGGVEVARGLGPIAHSDGDVAVHALIDAILGATADPAFGSDIGERFPNTDARFRAAPGMGLLRNVWEDVSRAGWRLLNADLLVVLESPKLAPHKPAMRRALSDLLGGPVGIKAGTNEGCGEVGRGEAVAAYAVVLLWRARP